MGVGEGTAQEQVQGQQVGCLSWGHQGLGCATPGHMTPAVQEELALGPEAEDDVQ